MSMPTQELAQKIFDIIRFNQTEYGEYNVPDIIALLDLERPTPKPETDEDARKLAEQIYALRISMSYTDGVAQIAALLASHGQGERALRKSGESDGK